MAIFIEKRGIAPQIEELNSQTGENTQDSLGPFQLIFEEMISRDGNFVITQKIEQSSTIKYLISH